MKNNFYAQAAPQTTDDLTQDYAPGSQWWWDGRLFICQSAASGAAVWIAIEPGAHAWPSNTYAFPDNCTGDFADITPSTSSDLLGFFPFIVNQPVIGVGLWCASAGSAGATAACGLYAHDYLTGRPGARYGTLGNPGLTATGLRSSSAAAPYDVRGLVWVGVHMKLTGLTTAPTVTCMSKANGRHLHRGDGTDLQNKALIQMWSSTDAHTGSSPNPPPAGISTINRNVAVPMLRSA